MTGASEPRPYPPSWVDRLTGWVSRPLTGWASRLPGWVFYLLLGLALLLLALLALWVGGVPITRTLLLYYSLTTFCIAYFLGLIRYLDRSAADSLAHFQPVLSASESGYADLRYRLTTLPARPAWIAFGLGAAYAAAALLLNLALGYDPSQGRFPPGVIALDLAYRLLLSGLAALMAYHTIHQLRMVSQIYTGHTRINLFQLGPLYALSGLAARTAIGISLPTYLWFWLNTSAARPLSLSDLFPTIFFSAMIVVTFVWPLMGAHRILEREKQRLADEVAQRIEATMLALHQMIDQGRLGDERVSLKETLDGLMLEQSLLQRIPTWPWQPGTVRGVGAAFLLPILIWLIQRLLERLGI